MKSLYNECAVILAKDFMPKIYEALKEKILEHHPEFTDENAKIAAECTTGISFVRAWIMTTPIEMIGQDMVMSVHQALVDVCNQKLDHADAQENKNND